MAIIYESVLSLKQANKLAWHLKIRDHVPVLIMILSIPDSAPNISPEPQGSVWHLHLHSGFLWQWMFDSLDRILQMHLSQNLSTILHLFDLQIQHMVLDFHLAVSILSIYRFEIVHYQIVIISFINPQLSLHLDQGWVAQLL